MKSGDKMSVDTKENKCEIVLPCEEFFSKSGDIVYEISLGEVVEVTHCGARISADGTPYVILFADEQIYPFKQGEGTEPTDCIGFDSEEFSRYVFFTREEAEHALEMQYKTMEE